MSDTAKTSEQSNTRWWESYLVRYFLGFVVGAICVAVIAYDIGIVRTLANLITVDVGGKQVTAKPDWTAATFAVFLLGLGYCYLASTPITVLHAGRYGRGAVDSLSRNFWFGWVLTLLLGTSPLAITSFLSLGPAIAGIFVFIFVGAVIGLRECRDDKELFPVDSTRTTDSSAFHPKNRLSKTNGSAQSLPFEAIMSLVFSVCIWSVTSLICGLFGSVKTITFQLVLFGVPVLWIGIVQYFVLYRLLRDESWVNQYYAHLFQARRQEGSRDVRETYTHLREHSNSVFVVLVELCWLAMILATVRLNSEKVDLIRTNTFVDGATYALFAIGVWVVPTIFMWSRANAMERMFAESPATFLSEPSIETDVLGAARSDMAAIRKPDSAFVCPVCEASEVGKGTQ